MRPATRKLTLSHAMRWSTGAALFASLCCVQLAAAQGMRDPTRSPLLSLSLSLSLPLAPAAPVSAPKARELKTLALVSGPLTLIERDGQLHVLLDARLYAEGQRFGEVRIERIRESEVWFRDGAVLYKMSRFPGVQRSSAATLTDTPAEQIRLPSSHPLR